MRDSFVLLAHQAFDPAIWNLYRWPASQLNVSQVRQQVIELMSGRTYNTAGQDRRPFGTQVRVSVSPMCPQCNADLVEAARFRNIKCRPSRRTTTSRFRLRWSTAPGVELHSRCSGPNHRYSDLPELFHSKYSSPNVWLIDSQPHPSVRDTSPLAAMYRLAHERRGSKDLCLSAGLRRG